MKTIKKKNIHAIKEVYINNSSYNFLDAFQKKLQNKDSKKIILNFINEVTKLNLEEITFKNTERLQGITEYDFYLINLIGTTKDGIQQEIFIKNIKKGKIKESLFCICDLACEKYLNNNYIAKDNFKKIQKISILEEKKNKKNINKVSVRLYENKLDRAKANINIYFVNISDTVEQNNYKKKERCENIEINQNEIVIVGVKNIH